MLPRTPRDVLRLNEADRLLYGGAIALVGLTRLWDAGIDANGDLEEMRTIDKIYWVYKTTNPISKPRRGSDLETFFARQDSSAARVPEGFTVESTLTIAAAGDLIPHPFLTRSAGLNSEIDDLLFGADLSMANLECVVVPDQADPPVRQRERRHPVERLRDGEVRVRERPRAGLAQADTGEAGRNRQFR
ncbi:MAG: hypothetical protein KY432_10755, partial [Acidobacteria bacterium]|nr:hypothetical protein [Acidobacteriota bacterium]